MPATAPIVVVSDNADPEDWPPRSEVLEYVCGKDWTGCVAVEDTKAGVAVAWPTGVTKASDMIKVTRGRFL